MAVEILDAVEDAPAWHGRLGMLPVNLRDIYFAPEYVALHRFRAGSRALLFVFERAGLLWLHPFVLTPIDRIGEERVDPNWKDLETAYGYGGPLASSDDPHFLAEAHRAFHEWCLSVHVIAEFVRLHPLLRNERWLDPATKAELDRHTVSLDLSRFREDPWLFGTATRNMIRRAERGDVAIEVAPATATIHRFVPLYRATLRRLGADSPYYFNDSYFASLAELADAHGWLVVARRQERWVAAAMFLRGAEYVHYHLSAAEPGERLPGVANRILWEGARLGADAGFARLHLGGGHTRAPSDTLFRFKRTMGTDVQDFLIARRVHDQESYARVRSLWEARYPELVERKGARLLCYRDTE